MAAALPGMDSTPEKSKEDSILVFSSADLLLSQGLAVTFGQIGLTDFFCPLWGSWGWLLQGFCRHMAETM